MFVLRGCVMSIEFLLLVLLLSAAMYLQVFGHTTHAMTVDRYGGMDLESERQVARTIGRIPDSTKLDSRPDSSPSQETFHTT